MSSTPSTAPSLSPLTSAALPAPHAAPPPARPSPARPAGVPRLAVALASGGHTAAPPPERQPPSPPGSARALTARSSATPRAWVRERRGGADSAAHAARHWSEADGSNSPKGSNGSKGGSSLPGSLLSSLAAPSGVPRARADARAAPREPHRLRAPRSPARGARGAAGLRQGAAQEVGRGVRDAVCPISTG